MFSYLNIAINRITKASKTEANTISIRYSLAMSVLKKVFKFLASSQKVDFQVFIVCFSVTPQYAKPM